MDRSELPPVYTRQQALAAGLTRTQLRDDGVRVSRGAYVSRAVPLGVLAACRAVLPVLPSAAAFSHATAAALLGAPVPHDWPLAVSLPPDVSRPRRRRIRAHVRNLADEDVVRHRGLPLTSGPQTWLDLATLVPPAELLAVGDALVRAGHQQSSALARRLERASGTRGIVLARSLGPLLTPYAASRPESLLRYALIDSDLPDPEVQVPVRGPEGRPVAHADLGYSRWKIALEYEGRHHAERGQFDRDIERYSLMGADGWLVLRFGRGALGRLDTVVERTRRALVSRGATW